MQLKDMKMDSERFPPCDKERRTVRNETVNSDAVWWVVMRIMTSTRIESEIKIKRAINGENSSRWEGINTDFINRYARETVLTTVIRDLNPLKLWEGSSSQTIMALLVPSP